MKRGNQIITAFQKLAWHRRYDAPAVKRWMPCAARRVIYG